MSKLEKTLLSDFQHYLNPYFLDRIYDLQEQTNKIKKKTVKFSIFSNYSPIYDAIWGDSMTAYQGFVSQI